MTRHVTLIIKIRGAEIVNHVTRIVTDGNLLRRRIQSSRNQLHSNICAKDNKSNTGTETKCCMKPSVAFYQA